jgi:hypothetical protein
LVDGAVAARRTIEGAGCTLIEEREVVVAGLEARPGALGETTRRVADAGVNIDLAYLATNTRLVLGAADVDKMNPAI